MEKKSKPPNFTTKQIYSHTHTRTLIKQISIVSFVRVCKFVVVFFFYHCCCNVIIALIDGALIRRAANQLLLPTCVRPQPAKPHTDFDLHVCVLCVHHTVRLVISYSLLVD